MRGCQRQGYDLAMPTFWGVSEVGWVALGAVGTVGALVVALALGLWVNGVSSWFFKPRLMVTIRPGLPDFCPVDLTAVVAGQVAKISDQYYCRFRVGNGRRWCVSANDVEVLLSQLWDVAQ